MTADLDACARCHGTGKEPGLLPVPGLEPSRLRRVTRDGKTAWQFRCPTCHQWGGISDAQLHGKVSIDHTDAGCTFHQTCDLYAMAGLPKALRRAGR